MAPMNPLSATTEMTTIPSSGRPSVSPSTPDPSRSSCSGLLNWRPRIVNGPARFPRGSTFDPKARSRRCASAVPSPERDARRVTSTRSVEAPCQGIADDVAIAN